MKAILEFNLPEESTEHQDAIDAGKIKSVLCEMDKILKNYLKYGHEFKKATEAIEEIRMTLNESLKDNEINIF